MQYEDHKFRVSDLIFHNPQVYFFSMWAAKNLPSILFFQVKTIASGIWGLVAASSDAISWSSCL